MSTGDSHTSDITEVRALETELLNLLEQHLPTDRRAEAPDIARRMAHEIDHARSAGGGSTELASIESLSPSFRRALLDFGERNKYRDVSIGDIIGRDKYLVNVNLIQQTARGKVFLPMPVPTYLVQRPEYSAQVKDLLRDNSLPAGSTKIVAIHGLDGIGKSTLAAALIQDQELQGWFKDGILSATLGAEPNLLAWLNAWIHQLSGAPLPLDNMHLATAELSTQVQGKAILLVLDDVQEMEHIQPFITSNELAPLLVTTRRAEVATARGSDPYELGEMSLEQSLELIVRRMGRKLTPAERPIAVELVRAVGYLPLALEMLAARMVRNRSWTELLKTLREQITQIEALEALEDPLQRRAGKSKLDATLSISLNALREEDSAAWELFPWLGILRSNALISAPLTARLWSVSIEVASEVLEILWNDALLLQGPVLQVGGQSWSSYRLHNLLGNIGRRILTAPQVPAEPGTSPGLGLNLVEAHANLLNRYRASATEGKWHTLTDDGYILSHLIWHLEQAKEQPEIHALLREETSEGRNGWYEARGSLENLASYLQDVRYAWKLAEQPAASEVVSAQAIGLQCRYLLVMTSVRNLVQQIPEDLLIQAVEAGLWPIERVLAYLHDTDAVELLDRLVTGLSQPQLQLMVPWALASTDEAKRAITLSLIVPRLPEPERSTLVPEVLSAVEMLFNSGSFFSHIDDSLASLRRLGPAISESQLRDSLSKWATDYPQLWVIGVEAWGPFMPEALAAEIEAKLFVEQLDENSLAPLIALLPRLPKPDRDRVVQLILEGIRQHAIDVVGHEYGSLGLLLDGAGPLLSESQLRDTLDLIEGDRHLPYRSKALARLIAFLPDSLIPDAERVLWSLDGRSNQLEPLTALIPRLTRLGERDKLRRALKVIRSDSRGITHLSDVIVIPYLAPKARNLAIQEILESTLNIDSRYTGWSGHQTTTVKTLLDVGAQLGAKDRHKLLQKALDITSHVPDEWQKARVLESMAPVLSDALLEQAWQIAKEIEDPDQRAYAMERVASYLNGDAGAAKRQEALAEAQKMENRWWQAVVLARLARSLSDEQRKQVLNQALIAAEYIGDTIRRAEVSLRLASYLESDVQQPAVQQTILDLRRFIEYWPRILPNFARYLSAHELAELMPMTLSAVSGMRNRRLQAVLMMGLSLYVPESQVDEGLKVLQRLESEWDRAKVLARLAANLPKPLPTKVLSIAFEMKSPSAKARALIGLGACEEGPRREKLLQQALDAILGIDKERRRVKMLSRVAPLLSGSEPLLLQALEVARKADSDWCAAGGLAVLIPSLPPELRQGALNEALALTKSIKRRKVREGTYILLLPYIDGTLSESVLRSVFRDFGKKGKSVQFARTFSKVLPYVPTTLLPEILEISSKFTDPGAMPKVLRALVLSRHFPEGDAHEALKNVNQVTSLPDRARALVELAPLLSEAEREEVVHTALRLVMQSGQSYAEAVALRQLAALLPKSVIDETLEDLQSSWSDAGRQGARSLALSGIVARLAALGEWERALRLLGDIVVPAHQTWALSRMVSHLVSLPPTQLYPMWFTLLHELESTSRKGLLSNLVAIVPLIVKLGGSEALRHTIDAIRDVGRWWP